MTKKVVFFLTTMVILSGIMPAFAEVIEFQLDKTAYIEGDSINAKGVVSSDSSGMVTIVLRDPSDEFVLLSQAFIQDDDSFETNIPINKKFQVTGTHNATAFVLNMTAGKTKSFDLVTVITDDNSDSNKDLAKDFSEIESILQEELELFGIELENESNVLQEQIEDLSNPTIQEKLIYSEAELADFVDTNKNPQYYLDRYYNEPSYKLWFDRNYPNLTIEEAVGYTDTTKSQIEPLFENVENTIIPQAEAVSYVSSPVDFNNNNDMTQVGYVLGGLAVLFGSVYVIKRKIDGNSKRISLNPNIIRRKIIASFFNSDTTGIIQTRLAKGEISIEEYENLKQKLDENSR